MTAAINEIICGDALDVLRTLPDKYCRCCVTSPPYYGLRDYGVSGQIGLEATMQECIARLVDVFAEAKRVLTDDGTLWVNIADCYAGSGKGAAIYPDNAKKYKQGTNAGSVGHPAITNVKSSLMHKNLMLMPQRFVIAMQDNGWIVRDEVIWVKPNPMPESVRDRMTTSTEKIFMFTKNPRYFFDSSAAIEPAVGFNNEPVAGSLGNLGNEQSRRRIKRNSKAYCCSHEDNFNESGTRRMRNVWNIATAAGGSKSIMHYAKFPDELAKRCILLSTAEKDCVLDPFAGSGTTCRVANRYGRNYIGIDLNPEYCKMAEMDIPINLF